MILEFGLLNMRSNMETEEFTHVETDNNFI